MRARVRLRGPPSLVLHSFLTVLRVAGIELSATAITSTTAFASGSGGRDFVAESMFEYGSRAGYWRLSRILGERNLPATVMACALAMDCSSASSDSGASQLMRRHGATVPARYHLDNLWLEYLSRVEDIARIEGYLQNSHRLKFVQ
ncbi:MAG: hypothetical protein PS018_02625 [bacterium]|nr:hypothetical protein [bacterium]